MAGISNDASLRGKVRAVAKKNGLRAQEVLQMYLFEHLLLRLAASPYSDRFVLKGGLLISFMIGLAQRTTMDMDATVVGMSMDRESVERAVTEVCSTAVGDGMEYAFERVEPIREDDEYANWRVHIRVRYGRMDAPVKVDITTGDSIVPSQTEYPHPLMFEGGSVNVMSYPLATVLAEKFKTVVRRGTANTRGRDFYDIYALMKVYGDDIDFVEVKAALNATAAKRGSSSLMPEYHSVLESVRASDQMVSVWDSYTKSAPYTSGTSFDEVVDAVLELGDRGRRQPIHALKRPRANSKRYHAINVETASDSIGLPSGRLPRAERRKLMARLH